MPVFFMKADALGQRDKAAGDGGGARAAIGLQHVAIDDDLAFAQRRKIARPRASERPDQALDFLGAAGLLARRRLAPHALMGGAGQHAIFRRHPALAGALQEGRRFFLQAGGDQDMGVAEFDQAGAFGMLGNARFQADGAHLHRGARLERRMGVYILKLEVVGGYLAALAGPRPIGPPARVNNHMIYQRLDTWIRSTSRLTYAGPGRAPARSLPPSGGSLPGLGRAGGLAHPVPAPAADRCRPPRSAM